MRGKWGVGDNRIKAQITVLRVFQRVFLADVEIGVMHVMQGHIHTREVVRGAVQFLAVNLVDVIGFALDAQQQ